jgi:hypothetical protein
MYNSYARKAEAENRSLLQKALTTATGVGGALIPENLEKEITNTIIRISPELALVESKKISGKTHEFNQLTALPGRGGAQGESATTPTRNSNTVRDTVTLKVVKRKGQVTNFLQDSSEEYIDAAAYEMENFLTSHVYDLINYVLYGNEAANKYEFSGLDYYIGKNDGTTSPVNRKNEARYGVVPSNLKFLDDMIDVANRKGGRSHRRAFLMSPEMLSHVSRLLTNVRNNQEQIGDGLREVEIGGGWRLMAYRNIPIIESSQTRNINTMGTVTPSTSTTGGTVPDGTYYFKVSKITLDGESLAAAASQVAAGGGTSTVTLTWAADANAYRYKIYCSTTQHSEKLVKEISGDLFDASGNITGNTTTVTFSTNPATADPTVSAPANLVNAISGTTVPAWMQSDIAFEQNTGNDVPEVVGLWDMDPIQGLGKLPYTNTGGANFGGLITTEELAKIDDWLNFLVKSYTALTPSFDGSSYWHRGLRTF